MNKRPAVRYEINLPEQSDWSAQVFTTPHNDRCIMSDYVLSYKTDHDIPVGYYLSLLKRFMDGDHFIVCKTIHDLLTISSDIEKLLMEEWK